MKHRKTTQADPGVRLCSFRRVSVKVHLSTGLSTIVDKSWGIYEQMLIRLSINCREVEGVIDVDSVIDTC